MQRSLFPELVQPAARGRVPLSVEEKRARHAASSRRWYTSNKALALAQKATWRAANRGLLRAKAAAYRAAHPERVKASKTAYIAANRERVRIGKNGYRARHPERVKQLERSSLLCRLYGITPEGIAVLREAQCGRCAICSEPLTKGHGCHVDHDHVTGKVRGLLCGKCNTGIGMLHDSPALVAAAFGYLSKAALP
jgi:hypothetical protein